MKGFAAGDLDRRVVILERTDTADPDYGTKTPTWNAIATVWAQVIEVAPSNAGRLVQEISLERRPATVRMRWRNDITPEHRLQINGVQMKIIGGPAMIGRREGLELMAEILSTEGQQP